MSTGSLFSGTGSLDLAVEALGLGPVAWHCENEEGPAAVLAHRFPDVPNLGDITCVDWRKVEPVDVLVGGFPCQDVSSAGRRAGIDGAKSGLWSFYADAVRALRPRLVLVENVPGLRTKGLDRVLGDLSASGYDARWCSVRASDAGAPHRRARIFLAAWEATSPPDADRHTGGAQLDSDSASGLDGGSGGHPGRRSDGLDWGTYESAIRRWELILGRPAPYPTEPNARDNQRLSARFSEWLMGLPEGWVTDVPGVGRTAQMKMLGNGCVPQQAELAYRYLLSSKVVQVPS